MKLEGVQLKNYRNYEQAEVRFTSDLVLILGDNASGKTNLLESIYFLSQLKSFRSPDEMLVRHGQQHLNLNAEFGEQKLAIVIQKEPSIKRGFKINDQKTKRVFWRPFHVVLFAPPDLNLFTAGPAARRKFLDDVLSQKDKEYALALQSLDHVLKQKSALLEQISQGLGQANDLDFWNEQLADSAVKIFQKRQGFIDFLKKKINPTNLSLMNNNSLIEIEFKTQVVDSVEEMMKKLFEHQLAEIKSGQNLIGPHRDDFWLNKDQVLNIHNSSRGELRAQILALKLLEAEYLSDEHQKPIILLDDVFSELDETRRSYLLQSLSGHQIFITSTEEHHLPSLADKVQILKIENNGIQYQ